jgi:hypothetical protein
MTRRIAPILSALLLACGGGGGTSLAGGGIGGTGISSGPITAIGSFFVTGTEWSVDPVTGQVFLDGEPFAEDDLALGMVVTVEGTRAADGTGTATRVEFDDDVEGPLDLALGSFERSPDETLFHVFGQPFVADRKTVYAGTTFGGFQAFFDGAVAPVVEVSGLPDVHPTQGPVIRATRIEVVESSGPIAGVTEVEIEGEVQSLAGNQFEIGPVTVLFNLPPGCATDLTDVGGSVSEGDRIEVEGIFLGMYEVCAEVIEAEDALPDAEEFEIEGIVTQVVSGASFWLAGIEVDAAAAAFEPASLQVQEGMRLEVEGALAAGVLVAEEVKQRGEVELEAVVTELIEDGFVLLGRDVFIDAATDVEDGPVGVGSFVALSAVDDGAGGLTATELRVRAFAEADRVRVQGRVESVSNPSDEPRTLAIAGISVPTDDQTECMDAAEQSIPCDDFFAAVRLGDEVQATDSLAPYDAFDAATELEFED